MSTLLVGAQGVAWPPSWADGVDAVTSELLYRLRSPLGSVPGDVTIGLPFLAWVSSLPTPGEIVAAVRAQAEAVAGVVESTASASRTGTAINVALTVTIASAGQTVTRVLSTSVYAGQPVAWYLRVGA